MVAIAAPLGPRDVFEIERHAHRYGEVDHLGDDGGQIHRRPPSERGPADRSNGDVAPGGRAFDVRFASSIAFVDLVEFIGFAGAVGYGAFALSAGSTRFVNSTDYERQQSQRTEIYQER
jgi:hypothetical protein